MKTVPCSREEPGAIRVAGLSPDQLRAGGMSYSGRGSIEPDGSKVRMRIKFRAVLGEEGRLFLCFPFGTVTELRGG